MFDDYDTVEKMRPNEITFSYYEYDEQGCKTHVLRTLRGEDAEYLPTILREFAYFLQGMTFTYVNGVSAHSDSGRSHSSEDA